MELVTTSVGIGRRAGPVFEILDLPERDLGELLRRGRLAAAAGAAVKRRLDPAELTLRAPVPRPGKVIVAGLNYRDHAREAGLDVPDEPICCLIAGSAVTGPHDPIVLPPLAPHRVDYEGEVAVVIGTAARHVTASRAWSHLAGLTICNDVSARDVARRSLDTFGFDLALSKSFDTFKPLGPVLVTADAFDPDLDLRIRTWVNGELRQDGRTSDVVFSVSDLVAHASRYWTLEPGDVIATGTPAGVGLATRRWLAAGDRVEIEVEGLGRLVNDVEGAPDAPSATL
jgi:2-keto-4-pentenoate hydratase/2-oxohepta-3-ene-1,7-dioic acid hydratase in catechol pathway